MNFEKVKEYLESLEQQFGVRCTDCIVLQNHRVVFRHLNGTADVEKKRSLTEDNLHNIFSASKVMTMIAVMQLVEQGMICLTDTLCKYLPEYKDMYVVDDFDLTDFTANYKFIFGWPDTNVKRSLAKTNITIEQMMSMTAGFSYNVAAPSTLRVLDNNPHASTQQIIRAFAENTLLYEPGTRYAYSYAHDILVAVVEVVSGMKFGDYMRKNVFDPVEVEDIWYQVPVSEMYRMTELYAYDPQSGKHVAQTENGARINDTYESGGAGIGCTVDAYSKVLDALANGGVAANGARILKSESIDEMRRNRLNEQQLADFHIGGKLEYGYGLGVRTLLDPSRSKSPVGEFGWDGAAGAYVLADPTNRLAVFYVQAAVESGPAFATIHPTLRDLVYDAIGA